MTLRVVVADDHFLVRQGIERLLTDSGTITVTATAADGDALLAAVHAHRPDAVLTDLRMPPGETGGLTAVRACRAAGVGVVALSQHADPAWAAELFRDGTSGLAYLLKDRVGDLDQLTAALHAVAAGGSVVDPRIVELLLAARHDELATLSPRELDVLRAMASGRTNQAIADHLHLSPSTVEKHVNAIFTKLALAPGDTTRHRRVTAVLTLLRRTGPARPS